MPPTEPQGCVQSTEKIVLVIPTLREAENLPALLDDVRAVLTPTGIYFEILVVDDDSRDGTEELVNAIHEADPRVRLLVRKGERGLSGAILYGWKHCDACILGVMDADRQHPVSLLPQLIAEVLDHHDMVIGSRYIDGGCLGEWNPLRKFFSAAAIWVTWPIQRTRVRVKDPMSGFFFVRRKCIEKIEFQPTGFKLLLEILVRGRVETVSEVPFLFGHRERGASKASLKVGWDYACLLVRLYLSRLHKVKD